jgi:hypothetical protein
MHAQRWRLPPCSMQDCTLLLPCCYWQARSSQQPVLCSGHALQRHHSSVCRTLITGCPPPDPSMTRWPPFTTVLKDSPPACRVHSIQSAGRRCCSKRARIIAHLPQLHPLTLKQGRHGATGLQHRYADEPGKLRSCRVTQAGMHGCAGLRPTCMLCLEYSRCRKPQHRCHPRLRRCQTQSFGWQLQQLNDAWSCSVGRWLVRILHEPIPQPSQCSLPTHPSSWPCAPVLP